MERYADDAYVADMYNDAYYPVFLVDKVKALLVAVVDFLETGVTDIVAIQAKLDAAVIGINDLQDEFEEHDSEIETVARESIGQTVDDILKHYHININGETAIGARDW